MPPCQGGDRRCESARGRHNPLLYDNPPGMAGYLLVGDFNFASVAASRLLDASHKEQAIGAATFRPNSAGSSWCSTRSSEGNRSEEEVGAKVSGSSSAHFNVRLPRCVQLDRETMPCAHPTDGLSGR